MGVAIVTGVFALVLAVLSWLLTNGSKRGRLLSRIERQTVVLKDLPPDHPARAELDRSLLSDVAALADLGAPRSTAPITPAGSSRSTAPKTPASSSLGNERLSLVFAVSSAILTLVTLTLTTYYSGR